MVRCIYQIRLEIVSFVCPSLRPTVEFSLVLHTTTSSSFPFFVEHIFLMIWVERAGMIFHASGSAVHVSVVMLSAVLLMVPLVPWSL